MGEKPETIGPAKLELTGTAFPALVAEPNYLSFPKQIVATTSPVLGIKLTNKTGSKVSLSRFDASDDFAIADRTACGAEPLEKDASCNINISFSPRAAGHLFGVASMNYRTIPDDVHLASDSAGPLLVSVQGRGVRRRWWPAPLGIPLAALWWSLLVTLLYLVGVIVTRWHMIAGPNRNLCRSQVKLVRSRLDAHPHLRQENPDFDKLLTDAENSIAKFDLFDFFFWTRGQEPAAWRLIHEVEVQLIHVLHHEGARASLEAAEPDLRHIGTPTAIALADRIHESLQVEVSVPVAVVTSLIAQRSVLVSPQATALAGAITKETNRDLLRTAAKFLQPQAALSTKIDQALQGLPQTGLAQDILSFAVSDQVTAAKQALEPSPVGFPSEWEAARQAILAFLSPAIDLAAKVSSVSATDPTLAQNQPLLQQVKDLLAKQSSVADTTNPILNDPSADTWATLLQKIKDYFTQCGTSANALEQAFSQTAGLDSWRGLHEELVRVSSEAASISKQINAVNVANPSASDLKKAGDFLADKKADLLARIQQVLYSNPPELHRWRALLGEATQLIYEDGDTNFDSLASWQNKAIWLVGCGILLIVSLSATIPNAIFFLVGGVGGYLSRLSRELKREDVPSDYGASWSTIFLSPVVGAITGWGGLLLAIMLTQLGILGASLGLDWNNPYQPVALGMAFVLGFSERLFDSVLSKLEGGIFKQPATPAAAPLTITTAPVLPAGKVGQDYSSLKVALAASGGTPDYSWSVASGSSLPKNLVLDATGVLHGIPASQTTAPTTVTIQVQDKGNNTAKKDFTITINP